MGVLSEIFKEKIEETIKAERQAAKEEAWSELKALLETKFIAQEKCIKAVESENRLLKNFLKGLGAEVDEKIEPLMKFSPNLSDPTETKFVTISFERRFITWDFKRRLAEIDNKIKRMRESE